MSMKEAISRFIQNGDTIVIEGFTHLICFAAGHEIIRQQLRDLTVCRLTPDLIYEQMIGAGCVKKLVFSWAGNPGAGPLTHCAALWKKVIRIQSIWRSTHILAWWPDSLLEQLSCRFSLFETMPVVTCPA